MWLVYLLFFFMYCMCACCLGFATVAMLQQLSPSTKTDAGLLEDLRHLTTWVQSSPGNINLQGKAIMELAQVAENIVTQSRCQETPRVATLSQSTLAQFTAAEEGKELGPVLRYFPVGEKKPIKGAVRRTIPASEVVFPFPSCFHAAGLERARFLWFSGAHSIL